MSWCFFQCFPSAIASHVAAEYPSKCLVSMCGKCSTISIGVEYLLFKVFPKNTKILQFGKKAGGGNMIVIYKIMQALNKVK